MSRGQPYPRAARQWLGKVKNCGLRGGGGRADDAGPAASPGLRLRRCGRASERARCKRQGLGPRGGGGLGWGPFLSESPSDRLGRPAGWAPPSQQTRCVCACALRVSDRRCRLYRAADTRREGGNVCVCTHSGSLIACAGYIALLIMIARARRESRNGSAPSHASLSQAVAESIRAAGKGTGAATEIGREAAPRRPVEHLCHPCAGREWLVLVGGRISDLPAISEDVRFELARGGCGWWEMGGDGRGDPN